MDRLVDQVQTRGVCEISWRAEDQASGIYFYRLDVGGFTDARKMILLR